MTLWILVSLQRNSENFIYFGILIINLLALDHWKSWLLPNLENFHWGGHVLDYHCIEDFWSKLNLITTLRLSDKLYESSTKYYLKGIPIEQCDCCFIIYSPVATLPYFIFNHILSWVFLQTCKDHFNLHLYLLAWVASKG